MEEVKSDTEVQAQYIARNPVSRVIQCAAVQSENEVTPHNATQHHAPWAQMGRILKIYLSPGMLEIGVY